MHQRIGPAIKRARVQRGLTQQGLADLLNLASGWGTCRANDVYRWETNRRQPEGWLPHIQDVLGLDFAAAPALPSGTLPPTVETNAPVPDGDDVLRRDLLRCLTVTAALIAVPALDADQADAVDDEMTSALWQIHGRVGSKQAVYPVVADTMGTLADALGRPASAAQRRQLCAQVGSLYQIAGEIRFDANRYTDAAQCYSVAASAAREAGDHDLWACALVRHAYAELYADRPAQAAQLLSAASRIAERGDPALSTRYWVAAVQAETYAALRNLRECQRALGRAEEVHALTGPIHNGGWLRFDGSRLAEERGTCYVALERTDLAHQALIEALAHPLSPRRRGAVLAELAVLGAQRGDLDQAAEHANNALALAGQTGSGYIGHKLDALTGALAPYAADRRVSELHHRIKATTRGSSR